MESPGERTTHCVRGRTCSLAHGVRRLRARVGGMCRRVSSRASWRLGDRRLAGFSLTYCLVTWFAVGTSAIPSRAPVALVEGNVDGDSLPVYAIWTQGVRVPAGRSGIARPVGPMRGTDSSMPPTIGPAAGARPRGPFPLRRAECGRLLATCEGLARRFTGRRRAFLTGQAQTGQLQADACSTDAGAHVPECPSAQARRRTGAQVCSLPR